MFFEADIDRIVKLFVCFLVIGKSIWCHLMFCCVWFLYWCRSVLRCEKGCHSESGKPGQYVTNKHFSNWRIVAAQPFAWQINFCWFCSNHVELVLSFFLDIVYHVNAQYQQCHVSRNCIMLCQRRHWYRIFLKTDNQLYFCHFLAFLSAAMYTSIVVYYNW